MKNPLQGPYLTHTKAPDIVSILGSLMFCFLALAFIVVVVAFRVAALKTRPPKPNEPRREANRRLWRSFKAELRGFLSSPLLWAIVALITALLIARGVTVSQP
jgi:hypothetical protein